MESNTGTGSRGIRWSHADSMADSPSQEVRIICIAGTCSDAPEAVILAKNIDWILGDFLAIEKHLTELDSKDIDHSWCIKKHFTHLIYHGLDEAIEHSAFINKELSQKLREFKEKVEEVARHPTLREVRRLRNEFRKLVGDVTYGSPCPLCGLDV